MSPGRTQFAAPVDEKGRVTVPAEARRYLDIEPGAATIAVSVALDRVGLETPIVTGDP